MKQLPASGEIVRILPGGLSCAVGEFLGGGGQGEDYRARQVDGRGGDAAVAPKWHLPDYLKDDAGLRSRSEQEWTFHNTNGQVSEAAPGQSAHLKREVETAAATVIAWLMGVTGHIPSPSPMQSRVTNSSGISLSLRARRFIGPIA